MYHMTHNNTKERRIYFRRMAPRRESPAKTIPARYSKAKSSKNHETARGMVTSYSSYQIPHWYIHRLGVPTPQKCRRKKKPHEQEEISDSFNFELTEFSSNEFTHERDKKINLK